MDGTRKRPTRRCVNPHPAPELAEAVTISRFWRMVERRDDGECWPWTGDTDGKGYGIFYYQGKRRPAHEMALSFTTGEARPEGYDTCHSCDTPLCCNPACLRFDTRQSNVDDMIERDRKPRGEGHAQSKLTSGAIRTIRQRRANGALQADLASEYGVSAAYISEIVNGLVWQDAGGPITGRGKRLARTPASRRGKAA